MHLTITLIAIIFYFDALNCTPTSKKAPNGHLTSNREDPFKKKALLHGRYEATGEIIGSGGYGAVMKALDRWADPNSHREVAIKIMSSSKNYQMPETLYRYVEQRYHEQEQQQHVEPPEMMMAQPVFNQTTNQFFYMMHRMNKPAKKSHRQLVNEIGPTGVSPAQIQREVDNMQKAQICQQTLRLYETFTETNGTSIFMVMPLMQSSLSDLIHSQQISALSSSLRLKHIRTIARHIFEAAACLHANEIIHNDLKPQNILISSPPQQPFGKIQYDVKLTDFGLSIASPADRKQFSRVTEFYEAPEITLGLSPSAKSDVWSIGVTLAELVTGKLLFPATNADQEYRLYLMAKFWHFREEFPLDRNDFDILNHFQQNAMQYYAKEMHYQQNSPIPPTVDTFMFNVRYDRHWDNLKDLILRCLKLDPRYRISVDAALKHPFFAN